MYKNNIYTSNQTSNKSNDIFRFLARFYSQCAKLVESRQLSAHIPHSFQVNAKTDGTADGE